MADQKNAFKPNVPQFDFAKYVSPTAEPSRLVGTICAVVVAGFGILAMMGIGFDPNLPNMVIAFIMALGTAYPLVQAEITRSRVYSPDSVEKIKKAAYEAGKAGEDEPTVKDALDNASDAS